MKNLNKVLLVLFILALILPIFVMLYTTVLFGNSFTEPQWWSAIVLSGLGVLLLIFSDCYGDC